MSWKERYRIIKSGLGGGQSHGYIVEQHSDSKKFFLKELSDNVNSERRERFYRETSIYETLQIQGIPKLIETNASEFRNKDVNLFYVAQFIEGTQLNEYIKKRITERHAIELLKQLLNILLQCHEKEVIHRDIKPENIIISPGGKLYIVDFGISYIDKDEINSETKLGQEIGNRFLRLPEFSAGSPNKRDQRSDLTLAVGIGLYLITGKYPRVLYNEKSELPHQTEESVKAISTLDYVKYWNIIFDSGFQLDIQKRWAFAEELIKILNRMDESTQNLTDDIEEILKLHAEQVKKKDHGKVMNGLRQVHSQLQQVSLNVIQSKASGFRMENQGWLLREGDIETKTQIRCIPIGESSDNFVGVMVKAKLIGNQVVGFIEINGQNDEIEITRVTLGDKIPEDRLELVYPDISNQILNALIKKIK